jgi:hypothetical protein
MKNKVTISLILIFVVFITGILYLSKNITPKDDQISQDSIVGCYVFSSTQNIYTLNIESHIDDTASGTLAFRNFGMDSSSGLFAGTYKDGILLGDYSFHSEGMHSVVQVMFVKSGDTFRRAFGQMNESGERFADLDNITFDPDQTFVLSPDCIS